MRARPARAARSAQRLAGVEVQVVGTLQAAQIVRATQHVRRSRQQLEILRRKWDCMVGQRQQLEGVPPCPPRIGPAATSEGVGWVRHGSGSTLLTRSGSLRCPRGPRTRHANHSSAQVVP
jgi:hypothetical protein